MWTSSRKKSIGSSPKPRGELETVGPPFFVTKSPETIPGRAKVVEEELREIASEQQVNVDKLVDLVKENEMILDQMQDNLRQRIVQDVMKIVVMCDTNNDGK